MTNTNSGEDDNLGAFYMGRMRTPPEPRRILPKGLLTVITVLCFAGIIWYAYPQGQEKYANLDVPTIEADKTVYKFKPENPGGMEVPHQDSTVFDPIENKAADIGEVKNVMPAPEQPVDKAEAIDAAPIGMNMERLNLDLQIKEVGGGREKIVPKAEPVKKKPAPVPAPKPAVTKKEEPPKAETPKADAVTTEELPKVEPKAEVAAKPLSVGNSYIQLGSYRELESAMTDWKKLQKKFPQSIGKMSIRTQRVDLGAKGVFTRLQAGAVTKSEAEKICKEIKASGASGCIVVN